MEQMDLSLERLLFNLNTLAEMGEEITSPKDFTKVVKSSLFMVMGTFSSSKGAIFRYDPQMKEFHAIASKGLGDTKEAAFRLSVEAMDELAKKTKPMDIKSGSEAVKLLGDARETLDRLGARIVAFLAVKDELLGLICINEKFSGDEFTEYDFQLLSVMAQHISFSLHSHSLLVKLMHKYNENKGLYENLRRIYYDTIHAFAAAIDAKDAYTKGHSHRVSA
ncbi:MAG: GAF domain-containing protein, partial [Deltaproteobacteria bacterium]